AASLGAGVAPGAAPELGVLPVEMMTAAAADPVFAGVPASFRSLQWHGDTFELPKGATQLARSATFEQQAFVLGRAYALQFHLEVTSTLAREWMEIPDYLSEIELIDGAGAETRLLEQVAAVESESVPLARALFGRWLDHVVGL
ncbi:MAG TPA: hypothetical protein VH025_11145, partial [Solirubrobacteraceae bacterium]|nr:hypothetical protein [Solirubrobacteraceae bacterium]